MCVTVSLSPCVAIVKIATNPHCTLAEREQFEVCLQELIKSCGYSLSAMDHVDSPAQPPVVEDTTTQPLIIRSAQDRTPSRGRSPTYVPHPL